MGDREITQAGRLSQAGAKRKRNTRRSCVFFLDKQEPSVKYRILVLTVS